MIGSCWEHWLLAKSTSLLKAFLLLLAAEDKCGTCHGKGKRKEVKKN
jgi:hypothetical protein